MTQVRLAVDIGGTFTDFAVESSAGRHTAKRLTTPAQPECAVIAGIRDILQAADATLGDVTVLVHGTTLATNALIERKGARTAFVTTAGFRDVLAMRNESRYDQYDLGIRLPEPLIPRHLRLTVPERIEASGRILLPLDESAVESLIPILQREQVESIAIGFLHSFTNPTHERRARQILAQSGLPISLSSEVSPEMREWERFSTTAANAYIQPLMQGYLRRLETGLRGMGLTAPILLMLSSGSLTSIDTACRLPVRLVESGPAGGAIFAASIARAAGLNEVLSFDMGGTTAKICFIDGGRPQMARSFEVARIGRFKRGSGLPIRIPVIEMVEIGAGGGSLAHVDTLGRIAVGPESAGAEPGPACYGRGGALPAVTDANLLLGRYDPARFAGGAVTLNHAAAEAALRRVGDALDLSAEMAAAGIVEMVDETMANAARMHAIDTGKGFSGRTLIAFGGGGPVHATRLAEKIGVDRILIPRSAGVGSAVGFLRAPVGYEIVRSLYQRLTALDVQAVAAALIDMEAEANAVVRQAGVATATTSYRVAFMRYSGQGHEILVPLPPGKIQAGASQSLHEAFQAHYAAFYDRPVPGSEVEIMSFAVTVTTADCIEPEARFVAKPPCQSRSQIVRDSVTGKTESWTVLDRDCLGPGSSFSGPVILIEDETSTLVGRGWQGNVDEAGSIVLVANPVHLDVG